MHNKIYTKKHSECASFFFFFIVFRCCMFFYSVVVLARFFSVFFFDYEHAYVLSRIQMCAKSNLHSLQIITNNCFIVSTSCFFFLFFYFFFTNMFLIWKKPFEERFLLLISFGFSACVIFITFDTPDGFEISFWFRRNVSLYFNWIANRNRLFSVFFYFFHFLRQ